MCPASTSSAASFLHSRCSPMPRRASGTTVFCSIPTGRCGPPCHSSGPLSGRLPPPAPPPHPVPFAGPHQRALPSLGAAAALHVAGISPADVRLDGTSLRYGPQLVMPLSWRRVKSDVDVTSFLWGLIDFRGPALLEDLK